MRRLKLSEWIDEMLPLFLAHKIKRIDCEVEEGFVTAYWVGNLWRIDFTAK